MVQTSFLGLLSGAFYFPQSVLDKNHTTSISLFGKIVDTTKMHAFLPSHQAFFLFEPKNNFA